MSIKTKSLLMAIGIGLVICAVIVIIRRRLVTDTDDAFNSLFDSMITT